MKITTDTKLVPLLGMPLGHSYSVELQNQIFEREGLNYLRIPIEVQGDAVGEVVTGLRHMNIAGITATKPNKIEIMNYLDEIDPLAGIIGAVNVSVFREGRLTGYNTEGEGFLQSLEEEVDCDLPQTDFFCFGAGGAGRAICTILADRKARSIRITDCVPEVAEHLTHHLSSYFPDTLLETVPFTDKAALGAAVTQSDVVMNVSGAGMYPRLDETPADPAWLHPGQVAFDATYNPEETRFLREAREAGCRTFNGKRMLAYCGMLGYRLLTGKEPPKEEWLKRMDRMEEERRQNRKE